MTIRNMLPSRPVSQERLASDEVQLRNAVRADATPKRARRRGRSVALVLAALVGVGSVGTAAAATFGAFDVGQIVHGPRGKSGPVSTNFQATITPDHGPRGTVVTIKGTGCFDPSAREDSVTYNDGNQGGRFVDPSRIYNVPVTTTGYTYAGQFTIPTNAFPTGVFYQQCGGSIDQQTFTVTP